MSRASFLASILSKPRQPYPSIAAIVRAVANELGIDITEILSPSRSRPVAHARHEIMRRAWETNSYSLSQIGLHLGRDHSSVIHGIKAAIKRNP